MSTSTKTQGEAAAWMAKRIRAARARAKLSQAELGERMGVHKAAVSRWERGGHVPSGDSLQRIADGLGITVAELLQMPEAS